MWRGGVRGGFALLGLGACVRARARRDRVSLVRSSSTSGKIDLVGFQDDGIMFFLLYPFVCFITIRIGEARSMVRLSLQQKVWIRFTLSLLLHRALCNVRHGDDNVRLVSEFL